MEFLSTSVLRHLSYPFGCISAEYLPLENTCAYRFPYNDFSRMSRVSMDHMPVRILVLNMISDLYRIARGIKAEQVSLCVVFDIFSPDCSIPI